MRVTVIFLGRQIFGFSVVMYQVQNHVPGDHEFTMEEGRKERVVLLTLLTSTRSFQYHEVVKHQSTKVNTIPNTVMSYALSFG